MAGRNIKINQIACGMPQMQHTLDGWMISFIVKRTSQVQIDGEIINRSKLEKIRAVLQPLRMEELELKPEGQRSWPWYQLHVPVSYDALPNSSVVTIHGKDYKIMASKDYTLNGYIEYHLLKDYQKVM